MSTAAEVPFQNKVLHGVPTTGVEVDEKSCNIKCNQRLEHILNYGLFKLQTGLWILLSNIRTLGKKVAFKIKQKFFLLYPVLFFLNTQRTTS